MSYKAEVKPSNATGVRLAISKTSSFIAEKFSTLVSINVETFAICFSKSAAIFKLAALTPSAIPPITVADLPILSISRDMSWSLFFILSNCSFDFVTASRITLDILSKAISVIEIFISDSSIVPQENYCYLLNI